MPFEPKPRWPGAPPICEHANLPAHATWPDAEQFHNRFALGLSIDLKWPCPVCKHWHYWSHPPAPAGATSGSAREYTIPQRILDLYAQAKAYARAKAHS